MSYLLTSYNPHLFIPVLVLGLMGCHGSYGTAARRLLDSPGSTNQINSSDLPENLNGIGTIRVFTYGDGDENGEALLQRMRKMCSSTTTLLTSTSGKDWTWHEKLNRFFPVIRTIPDDDLLLLLDGDATCFPCPRDLRKEFQRFDAGVVLTGYPWNQETSRYKTEWVPPTTLIDTYDKKNDTQVVANLMELRYINAGTIMATAGALKYYLSQIYLKAGYVDSVNFDDQSEFWANLYLAQVYEPEFMQHHHLNDHSLRSRVRIAIDSEGTLAQIAFFHHKGRWLKTPAGHLQREHLYQKEVCIMHILGAKKVIEEVHQTWENASKKVVFGTCPMKRDDSLSWGCYECTVCEADRKRLDD